ncbi:MAG: hypothetical protein IJ195_06610 [Lachnospiraceae bacterium]|nr:hypothetical protein [Lachnospiraceae bacterium]MBQ8139106.1 hypothetical protein [Lachnospiraceae bacterium]MBR1649869.1 hypothetical protein [Lachnospiraceae bacterium]
MNKYKIVFSDGTSVTLFADDYRCVHTEKRTAYVFKKYNKVIMNADKKNISKIIADYMN